jgi:hypothetical protein
MRAETLTDLGLGRIATEDWVDLDLVPPLTPRRGPDPDEDSETLAFRWGLKRLLKREGLDRPALDRLLASKALQGAEARVFPPSPAEGEPLTLFAAREPGLAQQALEREAEERRSGTHRGASMRWFGQALGYPACCAEAFAGRPQQDDATLLSTLLPRGEWTPVPIAASFLVPALAPVTHYPCALDCTATQQQGAAFLARLEQERPGLYKTWMGVLRAPLIVWDRFRVIALLGGHVLGDDLPFRKPWVPCLASDHPVFTEDSVSRDFARRVLPLFQLANGLRVGDGRLDLFRKGHPVASIWCDPMPWLVAPG